MPAIYDNYRNPNSTLPDLPIKLKYFIASKLESLANTLNDDKIVPSTIVKPGQGDRFQVLAVAKSERIIRLRGNQTDGRITIMEGEILVGESPPLHTHHREDEYFHVVAGEIEFQIGDSKVLGKTGTWVFAPRFIPHTFRNLNSTGARLEYVFQPAGIEYYFEEVSKVIVEQKPDWQTQAAAIANKYGIDLIGTPNWNG
jgi:quercetin dioxygenase-like cupin family protein